MGKVKSASKPKEERRPAMPIILRDVPPGHHWGWYSREDPRMHLQVVDRVHEHLGYKAWLEAKGKRVFQPVGEIPAKVLKAMEKEVTRRRSSIEAEWVHLMIKQGWLRHSVRGTTLTLIAYPNTPNRFERKVELADHMAPEFAARFQPEDVRLNDEFAAIELWPSQPESRRPFIRLWPILWQD